MLSDLIGILILVCGMLIVERALFFHTARLVSILGSDLEMSELERLFPRQFRPDTRQALFAIFVAAGILFVAGDQVPMSVRGPVIAAAALALLGWDFFVFFRAADAKGP